MWLHSIPLPVFGAPLAVPQERERDPQERERQEDPLAPLNLSSTESYLDEEANISLPIGGHAYIGYLEGPASAPATPGILSEPSQYIHTHLPRRASLTPANLNLVGPVPPSASVIEQVRRESLALLGSATPPLHTPSLTTGLFPPSSGEPFAQMHWGSRRKSTTNAAIATGSLAMASPTKMNAQGAISRKSALGSGLGVAEMSGRSYSAGGAGASRRSSTRPATAEGLVEERRGSALRMRAEDSGRLRLGLGKVDANMA
jgi:hypothetical protein